MLAILPLAENLSSFLCLLHLQGVYWDPADTFHPVGEVRFVQILYHEERKFMSERSRPRVSSVTRLIITKRRERLAFTHYSLLGKSGYGSDCIHGGFKLEILT